MFCTYHTQLIGQVSLCGCNKVSLHSVHLQEVADPGPGYYKALDFQLICLIHRTVSVALFQTIRHASPPLGFTAERSILRRTMERPKFQDVSVKVPLQKLGHEGPLETCVRIHLSCEGQVERKMRGLTLRPDPAPLCFCQSFIFFLLSSSPLIRTPHEQS